MATLIQSQWIYENKSKGNGNVFIKQTHTPSGDPSVVINDSLPKLSGYLKTFDTVIIIFAAQWQGQISI